MLLLRDMFNLVLITLYLTHLVKPQMLSDALEDSTLISTIYTYMTKKPLFPIVGPVFMRRYYSVSKPPTTIGAAVDINETPMQNILTQSNELHVSEIPSNVDDLASRTTSSSTAVTNSTTLLDLTTINPSTVATNPTNTSSLSAITDYAYPWALLSSKTTDFTTVNPSTVSTKPTTVSLPSTITEYEYPWILLSKSPTLVTPMATQLYQYREKPLELILRSRSPVEYPTVTYGTTAAPLLQYNSVLPEILRVRRPEQMDVQEDGTDPFSTFLKKLLQVLSAKDLKYLRKLIKPFEIYVTTLVDNGKLMKLGSSISSYIGQEIPLLRLPTDEVRRRFFIGHISLEHRRRMLTEAVNAMLDDMDDVYDVSEEEAMQRVLHEVTMFPNAGKTGEQISKGFVDDVFLHPIHRIAGTTRGKTIFESIAKIANQYNIPYDFSRRFQENKHERIQSKDTNSIGVDLDEVPTTYNNEFIERRYLGRFSDSENRRHVKKTNKGGFMNSPSVVEGLIRPQWYETNNNNKRKLIIPISVKQNVRRNRNGMQYDKKKHSILNIEETEADDSNNDSNGIVIEVKIKNGKSANRMNRGNKSKEKNDFVDKPIERQLNEREPVYLKTIHNGMGRRKNNEGYTLNLDKEINEDNTREPLGTNKDKRGSIESKINYGIIDYRNTKMSRKEGRVPKTRKANIRKSNKTRIEYNCKPLPIINDKSGLSRNISNTGEEYSQLLIFCDQASTVSN